MQPPKPDMVVASGPPLVDREEMLRKLLESDGTMSPSAQSIAQDADKRIKEELAKPKVQYLKVDLKKLRHTKVPAKQLKAIADKHGWIDTDPSNFAVFAFANRAWFALYSQLSDWPARRTILRDLWATFWESTFAEDIERTLMFDTLTAHLKADEIVSSTEDGPLQEFRLIDAMCSRLYHESVDPAQQHLAKMGQAINVILLSQYTLDQGIAKDVRYTENMRDSMFFEVIVHMLRAAPPHYQRALTYRACHKLLKTLNGIELDVIGTMETSLAYQQQLEERGMK